MQSTYKAYFTRVADLAEHDRRALVKLYLSYYDGTDEIQVLLDLSSKSEVLQLFYHDVLVGFTTLQVYDILWEGRDIRIVYSGDTVVEKRHWGQQVLAFEWIVRMGELHREKPEITLYWFLIVKGHRTFRYLPAFVKSFYPHWSVDRSDLKSLADYLAVQKFGHDYNPVSGIVEFPESRGHLKDEIALPRSQELTKDAVCFFLHRNPGYRYGHELVCLCELTEENMKPFTRRIFTKTLAR
jgi:hypothetical protein